MLVLSSRKLHIASVSCVEGSVWPPANSSKSTGCAAAVRRARSSRAAATGTTVSCVPWRIATGSFRATRPGHTPCAIAVCMEPALIASPANRFELARTTA